MRNILWAALLLVLFGVTFGATHVGAVGQGPTVGGFRAVAVNDPEVTAAARFAVGAQGESDGTAIDLVSVLAAERQTVAGANYRLCLEVEVDGAAQTVKALVFKNLQRQYQLRSWEAADCGGTN
jgi:hypothetical protein